MNKHWSVIISFAASILSINLLITAEVVAGSVSEQAATVKNDNKTIKRDNKTNFFQRARSFATHPEDDVPIYVRNLSQTGIDAFKDITWLDIGIDYRMRYEYRNNDLRRKQITDDHPFLLRSRLYLGIKEIMDPLRLVAEFEDARRYNGQFPRNPQDTNEVELIQSFAELYFRGALGEDALGHQRPIRFRVGRMAWESVDRRLLGRNEWRNTTNNFEGFRLNFGQQINDWELELWGMQPVRRLIDEFDERNKSLWFYGGVFNWRKWSDVITIQPYYMGISQKENNNQISREIHSPAIRGYGLIPNTAIDYDLGAIYQFGHEGVQDKSAWAYLIELGYNFQHAWKPRLSAFYGFASGDRNPNDNTNNRFERFFGFGRPWSSDNYLLFENIKAPKIKLEFQPLPGLQVDTGYNWFWLASDTDHFRNLLGNSGENRDITGKSGDFIGHGYDIRFRYRLTPHINTQVGYSYFENGQFVHNRQLAALGETVSSSHFFYVQVLINAFK